MENGYKKNLNLDFINVLNMKKVIRIIYYFRFRCNKGFKIKQKIVFINEFDNLFKEMNLIIYFKKLSRIYYFILRLFCFINDFLYKKNIM